MRWLVFLVFCAAACDARLDAGHNLKFATDGSPADAAEVAPFSLNAMPVNLQINGDAYWAGSALVLTEATENQQGTAFFPKPFAITANTSMDVHLVFQIEPSPLTADGVTLVWHADPMGARALGVNGGGLSIGSLSPGVAVVFDTHNGSGVELAPGVLFGRTDSFSSQSLAARAEPFMMASGKLIDVWVTLRGHAFNVFLSDSGVKPSEPWIQANFDLLANVGANVFFGVTSATGVKFARHLVHALEVVKKE